MWQRWNQTTHIFEKSDDDGGSWVPLPLSGSVITEGTVADARLSSNVALKNIDNSFSADQSLAKTDPVFKLGHTGVTAKSRFSAWAGGAVYLNHNSFWNGTGWSLDDTSAVGSLIQHNGNGFFVFRFTAGANPRTPVELFRVDNNGAFYERARTVPAGDWVDYTPTITITSGAGNISGGTMNAAWSKVGSTLLVDITLSAFATNVGTIQEFAVSIPVVCVSSDNGCASIFTNSGGGIWDSALCYTAVGESRVRIQAHRGAVLANSGGVADVHVRACIAVRI
jgi:hypothetical protein